MVLIGLLVAACTPAAPALTPTLPPTQPSAASVTFPASGAIAGWAVSLPAETYTQDNLFDLVDGQADSFFVYNFQQVTTQRYQNAEGALLNIEVWQLAQPADAYGLFTQSRAGQPVAMGNEGDADPGRRVAFWQDRYYVHVNANEQVPDEQLMAFAQAMSARLPAGGERPALVNGLPAEGLVERSAIFFHEELSVQNEVWLGGDNLLSLSRATNGVVARYTLESAPVRLMLIQYPGADEAAAALETLRQAKDLELAAAGVKGSTLATVFGQPGRPAAEALLQAALAGVQP